jgi:hypothetical protein
MAERDKEKVPVDGAELIEKYITELGPIPERLHRNFRLIRDLDERSAQLQAQVDEKCRQQMEAQQGKAGQTKRAWHSPEDQALSKEIQAMQQQIINMAEEKVRSPHRKSSSMASLQGLSISSTVTLGKCCWKQQSSLPPYMPNTASKQHAACTTCCADHLPYNS